jgi:hypothetical protein
MMARICLEKIQIIWEKKRKKNKKKRKMAVLDFGMKSLLEILCYNYLEFNYFFYKPGEDLGSLSWSLVKNIS